MRRLLWGLGAITVLALAGCAGGGKHPATASAPENPLDLTQTALPGGDLMPAMAGQALLGGYTFSIDAATDSATVAPWRQGTATDDVYFLSVSNFLRPDSLRVTSVSRAGTNLEIGYRFTHPFAAPANLAGPATAANRADLGIAARMVFLLDLPTGAIVDDYTFFSGEAIANTRLLLQADGYYQPRNLLPALTGYQANTFPYKLVVDEAAGAGGNRVGVSNGGAGAGNYRTDGLGWQGDNISGTGGNNNWTGYDVLHQGQAADGILRLDLNQLPLSGFRLDTAVIAKYIDPRGGTTAAQKRANRLPASPADVTRFVYRMPFGAIDCGLVRALPEDGTIVANNPVSSTMVRFHVRDYDARAAVSPRPDLNDELDPTLVPAGTEGIPTLSVDIPGVTTSAALLALEDDDSAWGGDVPADSGVARDPLFFQGTVTNSAGTSGQVDGVKYGLLKIVDPEDGLTRNWEFVLDPNLVPQTTNLPRIVTYQAANVTIGGANDQPIATVQIQGGPNPLVPSGGTLEFEVASEFDTEGDVIYYDVDVNDDGIFEASGITASGTPPPAVPLYTGTAPVNGGASNVNHQARIRYFDLPNVSAKITVILPYQVAPATANQPPTATIELASASIPSGGTLTFELDAENDPDGDTVLYSIMYNYVSVFTPDVSNIDPAAPPTILHNSTPIINPTGSPQNRTARVSFTDGFTAPVIVDLPYTLGPNTCPTATMQFDFDSGPQGWVQGQNLVTNPLSNADNTTLPWGHFRHGCGASTMEANTAGGFSGGYWTSSDDGDDSTCTFLCDSGNGADYNFASPFIGVPAICLPGSLQVQFNYHLYARDATAAAWLYYSTDLGDTWTQVWTLTANGNRQVANNETVTLPDALAGQTILLRFRFTDTSTLNWSLPDGCSSTGTDAAALSIDNVRISAGSTGTFNNDPPTFPCQARTFTFNFDGGAQGWIGGQAAPVPLPNTSTTFSGYGSFRWTTCDSTTDTRGTTQAVYTASGGAISGRSLNVASDGTGTGCSFMTDYGGGAHYNTVGPRLFVPANCSGGTVTLLWNAYLNTDDTPYQGTFEENPDLGPDTTVFVRGYYSTDNGSTWNLFWSQQTPPTGGATYLNLSFDITGLAGNVNGVRLRYQFESTNPDRQEQDQNLPFGFYVDNIRLQSSNTDGFYYSF